MAKPGWRSGLRLTIGRALLQAADMAGLSPVDLVELQFVETRHKLLDLAAFLDRMDRHGLAGDYRVQALRAVLPILLSERADRTRAVLEALSDPSLEPLAKAAFQGASGAPGKPSSGGE